MTKFEFVKEGPTAVALKLTKKKGHILFSQNEQTIKENPEVQLSFRSVGEVDFVIKGLRELKRGMLAAGLPDERQSDPISELANLLRQAQRPNPVNMIDLIMQLKGNDNQSRRKEDQRQQAEKH